MPVDRQFVTGLMVMIWARYHLVGYFGRVFVLVVRPRQKRCQSQEDKVNAGGSNTCRAWKPKDAGGYRFQALGQVENRSSSDLASVTDSCR